MKVFVLLSIATVLAASASTADGLRTIHVSTAAGTVRDGTAEHPFATPAEALDFMRKSAATWQWTVLFEPGEYRLDGPLELLPEDSGRPGRPIVWRAAKAGSVTFTGARDLAGWRVRPDGRWETSIPAVRPGAKEHAWIGQLFVNGRRAKLARHPDSGSLHAKGARAVPMAGGMEVQELAARGRDLDVLSGCTCAQLRHAYLTVHHKWSTTRRTIRGFDAGKGIVATKGAQITPWNAWDAHSTYYVENVPAALDEPGEWLYDIEAGKIVYIPRQGETPANTRFSYPSPGMGTLLRMAGRPGEGAFVHDIAFENIRFACSDSTHPRKADGAPAANPPEWEPSQAASDVPAAVEADGAHGVVFRGCEIANSGGYGLWLREGCVSNRIEHCAIVDSGAGGVRIGPFAATQKTGRGVRVARLENARGTGFNTVDDCIISHGGRIHAEGVGVWIGHSPFNTVAHCEISDFFYTGVSIGWVWGYAGSMAQGNTLEFCRIRDIGQGVLSDMGGVYTLGTSYGTRVANNVICSVDSRTYGGWGLYTDEGSEGIIFENNLVYDTKDASFHQHYGKDNVLRNNILAFSREGQIALTRAEPHLSFTAERNIIYWDEGPAFTRYAATLKENGKIAWKGNIWWTAKGGAPVFNGKTFAQWQAKGKDRNGIAADPLFADAAKRDFRLSPESPALKAGFRPFDPSAAGVYGGEEWIRRADACGKAKEGARDGK